MNLTLWTSFEAAAFALTEKGQVSGLVKSDFGYHIIRLDEIKAPVVKPYSEVEQAIKQELIDQQALDSFYAKQSELEKMAFEHSDSLDEAAKLSQQRLCTPILSLPNKLLRC